MTDTKNYGPMVLRIAVGLLMLIPGISKLMNPSGIIGMLGGMGIPLATAMGWILILSEILFGASLILGWQTKYTVWPPVVILTVATLMVHLPNIGEPMGAINVLFHLLGIASLVSVFLSGPGAYALGESN